MFSLVSQISILFSLLFTLSSIHFFFLEVSIQQYFFNWIWGSQWTQQPSFSLSSSISSSSISTFIFLSSVYFGFNSFTAFPPDLFHGLSFLSSLFSFSHFLFSISLSFWFWHFLQRSFLPSPFHLCWSLFSHFSLFPFISESLFYSNCFHSFS